MDKIYLKSADVRRLKLSAIFNLRDKNGNKTKRLRKFGLIVPIYEEGSGLPKDTGYYKISDVGKEYLYQRSCINSEKRLGFLRDVFMLFAGAVISAIASRLNEILELVRVFSEKL